MPDDLLPEMGKVVELSASGDRMSQTFLSDARAERFKKRDDWGQSRDHLRDRIAEANEIEPVDLTDDEVEQIIEFLKSLTDPRTTQHLVPDRVPSGLPVKD